MKENEEGKVQLEGQLKNNIAYQRSLDDVIGYFLLGGFATFLMLGLVILVETVLIPEISGAVGALMALFLLPCFLFIYIYNKNFNRIK